MALMLVGAAVAAGCGGGSAGSSTHAKPVRLTAAQVAKKMEAAIPGLTLALNPSHEDADGSELQVPESLNEDYDYATIWVFKPGRTATDFSIGNVPVEAGRTTTGRWKSFGYGSKGFCTVNKEYGGYIVLSVLMDGTRDSCGSDQQIQSDGRFYTLDQALTKLVS
ncbi:MAG TPA: hypothetical protein VH459_06415 [Gaiellales bacterium]|jgi:hypothetical protein